MGEDSGLIERLLDSVLDWDGSVMSDGSETRTTITCGQIRDIVAEMKRLQVRGNEWDAGWSAANEAAVKAIRALGPTPEKRP